MDQNGLNVTLGSEIAQSLQAWPQKAGAAEAFVLDHPFIGYAVALLACEVDQRRRLTGDRVLLLLLLRRYSGVDRGRLHRASPSHSDQRQWCEPVPGPGSRRPAPAWRRGDGQTHARIGRCDHGRAAQPLPPASPRNARSARLTMSLIVVPSAAARRSDRVHQAGRQLERHCRRRLDNRHRSADQLSLFDVSIGLTARHCELARQRQGSLPHALPSREQPVGRIETFRLLRIGRSRHLSYEYYLLRRKSSTQRERSSAITRSKQKLPFAFGE